MSLSRPRTLARLLSAALLLNVLLTPTVEAGPSGTTNPPTHQVQPGETLSSIAVDAGTDVQTLMTLNGLTDPNQLLVGQVLTLAAPATPDAPRTYVVQEGDTLASIAAAEGVDPDALAAANGISDPNLLLVGMTLVVPSAGGAASQPDPSPPSADDAAPSLPTTPPLPPPHPVTHSYVVQDGDNLAAIAAQFGTTVDALLSANGLSDANMLRAGMTLQVPS